MGFEQNKWVHKLCACGRSEIKRRRCTLTAMRVQRSARGGQQLQRSTSDWATPKLKQLFSMTKKSCWMYWISIYYIEAFNYAIMDIVKSITQITRTCDRNTSTMIHYYFPTSFRCSKWKIYDYNLILVEDGIQICTQLYCKIWKEGMWPRLWP